MQDRLRALAEDLGRRAGKLGLAAGLNPYTDTSPLLAEIWEQARKEEIARYLQQHHRTDK